MGRAGTRIRNCICELRALRDAMTQQELATHVGVSRQTIIAIEGGKHSPSLEVAFRIARVLGQPLDALFQLEE
jgi:putative transcriptional regulator